MEKIEHLWNVTQYLTKLQCPEANRLQNFYIERCRNAANEVELPKSCFGPSMMCSYCGSLWTVTDHQIRLLSGRKISRSVSKIIKKNTEGHKLPKVQATLVKKCKKNEMNKIAIRCSVCSRRTEIQVTKPRRKIKVSDDTSEDLKNLHKKKKKKAKDKTVGLNISGSIAPELQTNKGNETVTNGTIRSKSKNISTPKLKKLNISKLKDVVNQSMTPPNRKSLTNFLKELA
ncbi:hypothetical protein KPH14_010146 [Odynerus spinipes]|uniref:Uncharacterized protein n=1 Tax=Odynerus spinipes TaxID=1348599 RepID=A0AAD9RTM2_9HYME|nr:hypothetical protein KPH14_010146 [Odynerus spinipes]